MRFAIYGTGGVGGYFGGRLAEAGEDVTFIARGKHLKAIQDEGLFISSPNGDIHLTETRATDDPTAIGEVDCVIVAVKAWQVIDAARAMRPLIGARTMVLPLENGVEAADQLAAELGDNHVLGGLCGIVAYREAPGHIRHAGVDPFIRLAERDNRASERTQNLRTVLSRATGINAEIPDDIQVAIWSKFLFICAMSGVGAITRAPIGETRSLDETRRLFIAVMEEICDVARASGVDMPDDAIERAMNFIEALPESSTASMQRDIMAGRPSELESQNGAVVRLGQKCGVDTPVNAVIHAALLPQERQARN
ncbi:2-dehydropantoate 2-reductase [Aidingimonas halophila]|uniref:2-dehydropantoate 2-reductase n=1 Tax=Aidingimonas halophila TaxID=574349 RepID=A0A1H3DJ09_9GAMM|nr:2-dehydropantoate 2-reductase [Aidingimonas halophila]GHC29775.1 2-dehydropantoate 2-reductase [Aidingimonas halophila]SDX66395.1 ketopantoate reductase [Aidingimonas halophila]